MTTASAPAASESLTLQDVIRTIPRDCFKPNGWRALGMVAFSVAMAALGYASLIWNPSPFLLPLEWIFTGTALTGWFVIGHDCGHRSFAKRTWINNWVGTVFFLPLIYPFHGWRLGHDQHHRFTNHTGMDNAWRPFFSVEFATAPPLLRVAYRAMRGYFWWLASIAHWAVVHFYSRSFMERLNNRDRRQYLLSAAIVVVFAAIALPTLVYTVGWWGVVKYWLMPWLVYHFWMSTFTLVHHTHPEIPFRDAAEWDAVEAQLRGTVHCDYPLWVEWLCHDISVHIPHHISTAIPAYHLRQADRALQDRFGDQMVRERFGWSLMRQIVQQCHLFDRRKPYLSFQELAERQDSQIS